MKHGIRFVLTEEQKAAQEAEREKAIAELPKGKFSIRWVQARACYQLYKGGRFVLASSGETREEIVENFCPYYGEEYRQQFEQSKK